MNDEFHTAAVYASHGEAEVAVRALEHEGLPLERISIVGRGYHTEEQPIGFVTTGDRIRHWGGAGAFWGGIWGLLFGAAFFSFPAVGLVAAAGPIVSALAGALEGAIVVGGTTALAAGLLELGLPRDAAIAYESAVKADHYLVLVHGGAEAVDRARAILHAAGQPVGEVETFAPAPDLIAAR